MPPRRGCRTTNPARSVDSAGGPALQGDLFERQVETLSMGALSRPSVEQAKRLGATSFHGTTDPTETLAWLFEIKKILDEGMLCPNEDRVRIADFLLGGDAHRWWVMVKSIGPHTWADFRWLLKLSSFMRLLEKPRRWNLKG